MDTDRRHVMKEEDRYLGPSQDEQYRGVCIPEFHEASDAEVSGEIPATEHDSQIAKHHRWPGLTMPSYTFFHSNGTDFDGPIPFGRANTVRVDNYTPQWLHVQRDGDPMYIEPYSYGWIVNLGHATQNAKVKWESPAGVSQPAAVTGAQAFTTWYEERLLPVAGKTIGLFGAGSSALNVGQVSITTSATGTLIIAANGARQSVTIKNPVANTNPIYIGPTSAGTSTTVGHIIDAGDAITLSNYRGAVYGACSSTETVTYVEESA